jgi:hypothetical protein
VVNRLAAQDYAAEPPDYDQIDEIGDMAQALRVLRENGLERQRLERERDEDRVMRDLLSRMTQRMQGCDTTHDLTGVVERFVPEIAPGLAGRFYLLDECRGAMAARHDSGDSTRRCRATPPDDQLRHARRRPLQALLRRLR